MLATIHITANRGQIARMSSVVETRLSFESWALSAGSVGPGPLVSCWFCCYFTAGTQDIASVYLGQRTCAKCYYDVHLIDLSAPFYSTTALVSFDHIML